MGYYVPELEFWVSWPSLVTLAIAVVAAVTGFMANPWKRAIAIAILALITLYGIALTNKISTEPERAYAYFVVPPASSQRLQDGKVQMFTKASGVLNDVKACALRTADYEKNYPFDCWYLDAPEGVRPPRAEEPVWLGAGDWTIDVDGPGHKQTIRQQLKICINDGRAEAVASKVVRKSNNETLCETPERDGIPLC